MLRVADSKMRYQGKTGYHGVKLDQRGKTARTGRGRQALTHWQRCSASRMSRTP